MFGGRQRAVHVGLSTRTPWWTRVWDMSFRTAHTATTLLFLLLVAACGGHSSSPPAIAQPAGAEASPTSSGALGTTDPPPKCVPVGRSCVDNAYCCYGSCRVEPGGTSPVCAP